MSIVSACLLPLIFEHRLVEGCDLPHHDAHHAQQRGGVQSGLETVAPEIAGHSFQHIFTTNKIIIRAGEVGMDGY